MQKIILIIFFGLLGNSFVFANDYSDTWFECEKATECKKVSAACGLSGAVNKKFETVYLDFEKENPEADSCSQPTKEDLEADKKAVATCLNGKCELVDPSKSKKK